uniref:Uncharacterized protein n=1 Tax=Trichobilharzia regenti TaxID=157069 RepID=A0AA85KG14_TRIRE|nr:unnamed protein product [Trichobilharzia regenti]
MQNIPRLTGTRFDPIYPPSIGSSLSSTYHEEDLKRNNYRALSWDIPLNTEEFDITDDFGITCKGHLICSPTPNKKCLPSRDVLYFRNLDAKHFCYTKEYIPDYDRFGHKQLMNRQKAVFGACYFCINHPSHYEQIKLNVLEEINRYEDYHCERRGVKRSSLDSQSRQISVTLHDKVYMNEHSMYEENKTPKSRLFTVEDDSRYSEISLSLSERFPLLSETLKKNMKYSSRVDTEITDSYAIYGHSSKDTVSDKNEASVKKLYEQAANMIVNIIQSRVKSKKRCRIPKIYEVSNLSKFS